MALKSTIFRMTLQVADVDRGYYADHPLTIARHPSETDERMMLRVLAFALHADPGLAFGRGISTDDEPDLWQRDLTGAIRLWIDVGQPDEKLVRRACGRAHEVVVYTFGRGADLWWGRSQGALARMQNLRVLRVDREIPRDQNSNNATDADTLRQKEAAKRVADVKRIYVEVTRDQLEVMSFAINNGTPNIAVRSSTADKVIEPTDGVTWSDFMRWFYIQRGKQVHVDSLRHTGPYEAAPQE